MPDRLPWQTARELSSIVGFPPGVQRRGGVPLLTLEIGSMNLNETGIQIRRCQELGVQEMGNYYLVGATLCLVGLKFFK